MFGHESDPSKIYSYRAREPRVNLDVVDEQMRRAHRYRNALVEAELDRRKEVDQALGELSPELVECEATITRLEGDLESELAQIRRRRQRERKRGTNQEERDRLRPIKEAMRSQRTRRKALRSALFRSERWKARQAEINARDLERRRELRANSGLYWGTYLHVEQSLSGIRRGPPPKFRRWRGDGTLAVQTQGGLDYDSLMGDDRRLRLWRDWPDAGDGRKRQHSGRDDQRVVSFRVQSEKGAPVFAEIPILFDRSLPEGSRIKWAYVTRRRVACNDEWRVQFVVARKGGFPMEDRAQDGVVALDLGWRLIDGALRVAVWQDDRGVRGDLTLSARDVGRWAKADSLRAIRDRRFDAEKARLLAWLEDHELPEDLAERAKTIAQWKSTARLAAFAIAWRHARFDGDGGGFGPLEGWRKKDRHLYEWEANQRLEAVRWRDDLFSRFAKELRRRYARCIVEDANWKEVQRKNRTDEEREEAGGRHLFRIAAVGRLRKILAERGPEIEVVPAAWTTTDCHACGSREEWDQRSEMIHRCKQCRKLWDQDVNAARNLLRASEETVAE